MVCCEGKKKKTKINNGTKHLVISKYDFEMSTSKAAFRISLGFVDVYISFLVLLQFSSIFFTYLNFDTSALNEKFIIHFQFKAFLLLFISFRFCQPQLLHFISRAFVLVFIVVWWDPSGHFQCFFICDYIFGVARV